MHYHIQHSIFLFILYVCVLAQGWRSRDNLEESVLSLYHMGPIGGMRVRLEAYRPLPLPAEPSLLLQVFLSQRY